MKIFLVFLLLFYIISYKNKNMEPMTDSVDITTSEWYDHHNSCKKYSADSCEKNTDCIWSPYHDACLNKNKFNESCNIYNNNFLDNNPQLKNETCISIGCNNIKLNNSDKKICVDPKFNSHSEYCDAALDNDDCDKKIKCIWNNSINKCLPHTNNLSNDICKNINSSNFKLSNKCFNEKNFDNCYVTLERDNNSNIIPYTGLKSYRKYNCHKVGCQFIELSTNNNGLCVNKELKNEDDICINYYQNENIDMNKCHQIGCKYYSNLNKKYGGICISNNLKESNSNICNTFNNPIKCINMGCKYKNKKCYY